MEKQIVKKIKQTATKCWLHMFDVTGNHDDKHVYRERLISSLENNSSLAGIGIPIDLQTEILEIYTVQDQKTAFISFLFIDRSGRSLREIGLDAGLTLEEIEKIEAGEL